MVALQMFFTGLLSAIAIKLTSSVDDVLWLAPFLTSNVSSKIRLQNAIVYLGVCLVQTVIAVFIAGSGSEVVAWLTSNDKHAWSTDKILTVFAGTLLAIYTVKLTYEHFYGEDDDDKAGEENKEKDESESSETNEERSSEDTSSTVASEMELGLAGKDKLLLEKELDSLSPVDEDDNTTPASPRLTKAMEETRKLLDANEKRDSSGDAEGAKESLDKKRQQTLFMIAFIGSLDDLTLFVPMLVGHGFDFLQLMIGAFVAGSTIVTICLFIGLCKPAADFLSSIPLALIVATFSTVLLVKGFLM